jgi:hypothetical protein
MDPRHVEREIGRECLKKTHAEGDGPIDQGRDKQHGHNSGRQINLKCLVAFFGIGMASSHILGIY